jgi:hypothetical protein
MALDFSRERPFMRGPNPDGNVISEDRIPEDWSEVERLIGPRREIFMSTSEAEWYAEARAREERLAERTLEAIHAAHQLTSGIEVETDG